MLVVVAGRSCPSDAPQPIATTAAKQIRCCAIVLLLRFAGGNTSPMENLPIACTLGPAALKARQEDLLGGLVRRAAERLDIPDGYRVRFAPTEGILATIANVVEIERQCCRFLTFRLTAEPDNGAIWLDSAALRGRENFSWGCWTCDRKSPRVHHGCRPGNRWMLRVLVVASSRHFTARHGHRDCQPRRIRDCADPRQYNIRRAGVRRVRWHLHRGIARMALVRRRAASDDFRYRRRRHRHCWRIGDRRFRVKGALSFAGYPRDRPLRLYWSC
jgi:hypothetical protein